MLNVLEHYNPSQCMCACTPVKTSADTFVGLPMYTHLILHVFREYIYIFYDHGLNFLMLALHMDNY